MSVVDLDCEKPDIKTVRRKIWYTVGCYSCGNQVLESMPFGAGKTGYALLSEARAQASEYFLDVNGSCQLADVYELAFRNATAQEVRDAWDKHCPSSKDRNCTSLLIHKNELRIMADCVKLVIAGFCRLPRGGIAPDAAFLCIMADAGHVILNELADDMFARTSNTHPSANARTIRGRTYYPMPLPPYLAQFVARCIAHASGNPEQLAHHLFAEYGDAVSNGQSETEFIGGFVAAHGLYRPYFRTIMLNLAHYCQHTL
jgi:hypothetical protein